MAISLHYGSRSLVSRSVFSFISVAVTIYFRIVSVPSTISLITSCKCNVCARDTCPRCNVIKSALLKVNLEEEQGEKGQTMDNALKMRAF